MDFNYDPNTDLLRILFRDRLPDAESREEVRPGVSVYYDYRDRVALVEVQQASDQFGVLAEWLRTRRLRARAVEAAQKGAIWPPLTRIEQQFLDAARERGVEAVPGQNVRLTLGGEALAQEAEVRAPGPLDWEHFGPEFYGFPVGTSYEEACLREEKP